MNTPRVYTCSPSWTALSPPSLYHLSGSSQCTSPQLPVSCIRLGLAIRFLYDIIHVSMPFSQIIPPSPSPTESKRLFYTSVSLLLSRIQGYRYHLSTLTTCKVFIWIYIKSGPVCITKWCHSLRFQMVRLLYKSVICKVCSWASRPASPVETANSWAQCLMF